MGNVCGFEGLFCRDKSEGVFVRFCFLADPEEEGREGGRCVVLGVEVGRGEGREGERDDGREVGREVEREEQTEGGSGGRESGREVSS